MRRLHLDGVRGRYFFTEWNDTVGRLYSWIVVL